MATRLKVGVVGCGLVAQVMHLHYLRELAEQYEIVALCDLSDHLRSACARDYGVTQQYSDWRDLIATDLDAVLILSSGSHAPIATAAADAGKHLLIEKPMCFTVEEAKAMIAAAKQADVALMVAYNKRYDPAYCQLRDTAATLRELRLVRVTTLESPFQPYVAHYRLHRPLSPGIDVNMRRDSENEVRITAAIGEADALSRRAYQFVLLDSMVHEFNAVRGLLGEPDSLDFADIRDSGLTAILRFGDTQCIVAWVDLPGMARYQMEFAFFALDRRLTLSFPSPFLRSAPTLLITESGEGSTPNASRKEEVVSYSESFKQELLHFYDCVTTGQQPLTSGEDALRDIALCRAVVAAHRSRAPVANPTEWPKD